MITAIMVTNYLNESLVIDLANPQTTGLAITEITGLGPAKSSIIITDSASSDGGFYNSSRMDTRNIVITFRFLDGYGETCEDIRQKVYKYFPIKKEIRLTFVSDNRYMYIDGYIESNEPNIFSQESGTQISIICPDPWFYSAAKNVYQFAGTYGTFEFPFSNECITTTSEHEHTSIPYIMIGNIEVNSIKNIVYTGDNNAGLSIELHFLNTVKGIKIYNLITNEKIVIDDARFEALIGGPIIAGDTIRITTIRGRKSMILSRNGTNINIINAFGPGSSWMTVSKGNNPITMLVNGDYDIEDVMLSISLNTIYEGI